MAAAVQIAQLNLAPGSHPDARGLAIPLKRVELPQFAGVFRGRELTRKDRRLPSGLLPIDSLIGGGIVRGRISEIIGTAGAGKTSLAVSFAAITTQRGEAAAWIDAADNFDPESIAAAGVDLARMIWVSCRNSRLLRRIRQSNVDENGAVRGQDSPHAFPIASLKAAEWLLAAGGFGLVVIDFGGWTRALPQSAALRLARAAERSGTAVIVLAAHRMCGTFAALSLTLRRNRVCFSRPRLGAPVLFDGIVAEARVARNKLGGSGAAATWQAMINPDDAVFPPLGRVARVNCKGRAGCDVERRSTS
jgi:hypothetical protein